MPLVTLEPLLKDAIKNKYAVPEFNIDNIEFVQAILEAAEEEKTPFIFGVGQGAIQDGKLEPLAAVVKQFAEKSKLPIALHLDHSRSFAQIIQSIRVGFTSVMIDGSYLCLSENIAVTNKVSEICRTVGVSVEAELGKIGGVEDNIEVGEEQADLVDIEDLKRFVSEAPTDVLAVAIGSAHGIYKVEPKLDFKLLEEINRITDIPLVLHGGSGIPAESVKKAIELGINKVNIGTEMRVGFIEGMHEAIHQNKDIYSILDNGRNRIKEIVREKIYMCGAQGRA
ncbi:ketose-bisphosphate aldolase [Petroclostridium sp. X23]|uniref:class II fructose-bisphosphate aldolase n=1 Tax=Petroclostridium sp. X23 TaxID=3045146 RepID=UPI0024ACB3BF|nr:ketose-bisphosphate aldolase [Petroclostridium sp. X23]WHH60897.1 ketose-bisphosphate aldolase [Petroclostridium sp. X23]